MFVKKFALIVFALLALGTLLFWAPQSSTAESVAEDWFAPVTPTVTKLHDYSTASLPLVNNLDCYEITIGTARKCEMDTSIGRVLTNSDYLVSNTEFTLKGYQGFGWLVPVPNSSTFLDMRPGAASGQYVAFHRNLERKDLTLGSYWGLPPRQPYEVTKSLDYWLTDADNNKLQVNPQILAFSSNGYWMVFDVPRTGIFKVNMATMDVFSVGPSAEQQWDSSLTNNPIAISDDGRYVAMGQRTNLTLYDTSGCTRQVYAGGPINLQGCKYRDLWVGQYALTSTTADMGIKSRISDGSIIGNVRFVDDGNLRFDAYYNRTSPSSIGAAEYLVTASGVSAHKLGLLGMGDSYISGEGEFDYVPGTDESTLNMCHLSPKSYPYILGAEFFNDHHSVACSGAKTTDIYGNEDKYKGQFSTFSVADLTRSQILAALRPGLIFQNDFAEKYQPETALLSIGGNNVGFADILKSCVSGLSANGTCYATREERTEVLNTINSSFSTLVNTYEGIKNASPDTRIYVVGYPQIVKPDGICGDNVHLNASETEFAAQLTSHLDSVIARAAAKAVVFYVDTEHAFDGFRLCEAQPGGNALNGLTVFVRDGSGPYDIKTIANESYHPTVLGHQLLANAIAEQTHNLTAPMPDPQPQLGGPLLDANDPFLTEVPETGQNVFERVADAGMTSANYIIKGAATKLNLNGLADNLAGNSIFDIVLHSNPIDLGEVTSDANGNISATITLPDSVPAGLHTLHIYGKDFAGKMIDIQKVVYVVSSDGPAYDGYCQVVPDSHQDIDKDGIDDACDPVVGPVPIKPTPITQPADSSDSSTVTSAPIITNALPQSAGTTPDMQPAAVATTANYLLPQLVSEGSPTTILSSEVLTNSASIPAKSPKPEVLGASVKAAKDTTLPHTAKRHWLFWESAAAACGITGVWLVLRARNRK